MAAAEKQTYDDTEPEPPEPPAPAPRLVRRIRRTDALPSERQPDGFDVCMACWKAWMTGDSDRDLGAKHMRGLTGDDDSYGVDASERQQARDTRLAVATDAMIDSLSRLHRWALYDTFGIGKVWQFPNADLATTFADARAALEIKLRANFVTSVLF